MSGWQRSVGTVLIAFTFMLLFPAREWWELGIAAGLFSSALYLPFDR